MSAIIEALVDHPGRFIGSLVEPKPTDVVRQRWERPLLLAMLVIAAVVRFWGVGSFSLHKPDEDTTVLPAVHILVDGTPRFPSGMFYARAIAQSYLIAGSVKLFGENEWALRLPSVLCGLLVVWLAYFLGRRFLDPAWNMAFVAVVALLPGMIADSQEARMYIFLSASLAAYMILVFRWERTGRTSALVAAVAAMLLALQFQEIALFSTLLVLFPGLAHGDPRQLRAGLVALVVIGLGYLAISHWVDIFYPKLLRELASVSQTGEVPSAGALRAGLINIVAALVAGIGVVWLLVRSMTAYRLIAAALLLAGLLFQGLIFYHLAVVLVVSGLVVARRNGGARGLSVTVLLVMCIGLALLHFGMLHRAGIGPLRKILGVMVGQPSIWPYLQVADYSPVAMLLVLAALAVALWRLGQGARIKDDVLFGLLGVFAPLFAIGFFGWYIPPRYGEFALLPLLLCGLAAAQRFFASRPTVSAWRTSVPLGLLAAVAALAIVNPRALANSVNAGSRFADHRAAAKFLRSVHPGPRDIVVAEEVLMQTYYLGHIDYWLTGQRNASNFLMRHNESLVDIYTNTPVIYTALAFHALMDRQDRGVIYVIGSGEGQEDDRQYLRGFEISQLMREPEFQTVFLTPDGMTRVWKVAPPALRLPGGAS